MSKYCGVTFYDINKRYILIYIIIDPPGPVVISGIEEGDQFTEGQSISATCSSTGGIPPPTFTWTIHGEYLPTSSYTPSKDGGTSTSTMSRTLLYSDDKKYLRCLLSHPLKEKNTHIKLDVTRTYVSTMSKLTMIDWCYTCIAIIFMSPGKWELLPCPRRMWRKAYPSEVLSFLSLALTKETCQQESCKSGRLI